MAERRRPRGGGLGLSLLPSGESCLPQPAQATVDPGPPRLSREVGEAAECLPLTCLLSWESGALARCPLGWLSEAPGGPAGRVEVPGWACAVLRAALARAAVAPPATGGPLGVRGGCRWAQPVFQGHPPCGILGGARQVPSRWQAAAGAAEAPVVLCSPQRSLETSSSSQVEHTRDPQCPCRGSVCLRLPARLLLV